MAISTSSTMSGTIISDSIQDWSLSGTVRIIDKVFEMLVRFYSCLFVTFCASK